jgi:NitT/TauT family transport system substrate-binding protein
MAKRLKLAAAILCGLAFAAPVMAQQKVTYTMAGEGVYYMLHYIAHEGGFFAQENVVLDSVYVTSGTRLIAAVMGGSAEGTSVNLALVIQASEKGSSDVVSLIPIYDAFPHTLVLSNDAIKRSGITAQMPIDEKVKRLKGLKIGMTSPGSGSDQLVRTLMIKRGYDPDKEVSLQPLGQGDSMLAAFERGLVDGFAFTPPFPQMAETRGLGKIVIDPFDGDAPELQGGTFMVLATTRETIKKSGPALQSMVRAFTKAMQFGAEHPEEARKMTRKYFKDMDEAVFNATFDKAIKGLPKNPVISEEQFRRTVEAMNITAKTPIKAEYKALVDPTMAQKASRDILGK